MNSLEKTQDWRVGHRIRKEPHKLHSEMRHSYVNMVFAMKGLHLKNYGNVTTNVVFISKCVHRDLLEDHVTHIK